LLGAAAVLTQCLDVLRFLEVLVVQVALLLELKQFPLCLQQEAQEVLVQLMVE
jgi:hypothetical protein